MQHHIIHNPMGSEHPYVPGPDERIPRYPREGDTVTLGFIAYTGGGSAEIGAFVNSNEGEERWYPSHRNGETDEGIILEVRLPPFTAGSRVSYCFGPKGGETRSEIHEFHVGFSVISSGASEFRWGAGYLAYVMSAGTYRFWRVVRTEPDGVVSISFQSELPCEDNIAFLDSVPALGFDGGRVIVDPGLGLICILGTDGSSLVSETLPPVLTFDGDGTPCSVKVSCAATDGERFFGFGERFNALDQRGRCLDNRVYEEYKTQDEGSRTYLPVPFFLSSRGWSHRVVTERNITYDMASGDAGMWSFNAEIDPGLNLEYRLRIDEPVGLLRGLSDETAKPVLPPDWVFGPWMSSNEWNSQHRVLNEFRKTLDLGIPATVLVIEAWSDEKNFYIWNGAEYEPIPPDQAFSYRDFRFSEEGLWPDPKGMIDEIHGEGARLVLWQIPVMKKLDEPHEQHDRDEAYMMENNYAVYGDDGHPYRVRPPWFRGGMVMDFTNPEAVEWWMSKRAYLVDDLGIDGFKTDGGEHLWGRDLMFSDGSTGDTRWNSYPNIYIRSYSRFIGEANGGITFSRAGYTGIQDSPLHWAGDQDSTWSAHRSVLKAVLNSGLSGIPFMGWDIGGFSGAIPTPELYLRSAAMACFGSVMQYHSEFNDHIDPHVDRTPWNIAERTGSPEVIDIYRFFARLRMALIPYITREAAHCSETGEPLMRCLFIDHPGDPRCWEVEDQYFFGRSILVAPVMEEGLDERSVYLPNGEWIDFWSGESINGGVEITVKTPLDRIPVYRVTDELLDDVDLSALREVVG